MAHDPDKQHRRSIRLPRFDYTQPGAYFVTICTHYRECLFGEVVDGAMVLNDWGIHVDGFWSEVSGHFPRVTIDMRVVMPNHVHANIMITPNDHRRGGVPPPRTAPDAGAPTATPGDCPPASTRGHVLDLAGDADCSPRRDRDVDQMADRGGGIDHVVDRGGETPPLRPTLGQIVAYYKYQTTKAINQMRDMPGAPVWQRNYWEHVIRNEAELARIRQYIADNPARWTEDQLNPAAQHIGLDQE